MLGIIFKKNLFGWFFHEFLQLIFDIIETNKIRLSRMLLL